MVEASEPKYDVERLVRYRAEDDRFLVKWVGYPANENTWEPRARLPPETVAAWGKPPAAKPSAAPVYDVERLVRHRPEGDHFLVKWVGYPPSGSTWEPKEGLPPAVVAAWWVGGGSGGEVRAQRARGGVWSFGETYGRSPQKNEQELGSTRI